MQRNFDRPISKDRSIGVRAVDRPIGLLMISKKGGKRPIAYIQRFQEQHRVLLTQKMTNTTQRASGRGISYVLGEGRYSVAAVPVLNPVNMCDVKHTPKHSRADGCAHTLHVKYSIK